jgi:uncharacterized membrane protein
MGVIMLKDNTGKIIRITAMILFILCFLIGITALIGYTIIYLKDYNLIPFSSYYGGSDGDNLLLTAGNRAYFARNNMLVSILFLIGSYIVSLIIYGFGTLVENSERSLKILMEIQKVNSENEEKRDKLR